MIFIFLLPSAESAWVKFPMHGTRSKLYTAYMTCGPHDLKHRQTQKADRTDMKIDSDTDIHTIDKEIEHHASMRQRQ